jgi:perosamine synthetase
MEKKYIPFALPDITSEEKEAVVEAMDSGWISKGPKVIKLEEIISGMLNSRYVVTCNSGTAALHLALLSLEIGSGDEVIVVSFTFCATVNVIELVGATPIFVDINEDDYCIDPDDIIKNISEKTKAVIAVHYGGWVANLNRLVNICHEYQLLLIEDAAHAFGSKYSNQYIGSHGDIVCFSFYATKNITTGEGGALVTNNENIARKARQLSWHGIDKNGWQRYTNMGNWFYNVISCGYKYNMTDIQAAMGIIQLRRCEDMKQKRKAIAKIYINELNDIKNIIISPNVLRKDNLIEHSYHLFPLRIKSTKEMNRDNFIEKMNHYNIGTSVHYIPAHLHPYYKNYSCHLPITEMIFSEIVSIPIYSKLSIDDVHYIARTIKKILK